VRGQIAEVGTLDADRSYSAIGPLTSDLVSQYRNRYFTCTLISRGLAKCVPPKVLLLSSR
jgi:hypothetical protein